MTTERTGSPIAARYPHVVALVADTLWTITEPYFRTITEVVSLRSGGARLGELELDERIAGGELHNQPARPVLLEISDAGELVTLDLETRGRGNGGGNAGGAIAVLPLYGVMIPRATAFSKMSSSGTSTEDFTAMFRQAVADPTVGSILLDVSSPGGSSELVPELGDVIFEARSQKPVVAIANTQAGSGAYWAASQANEVWITPSGSVGSIGVYSVHQDLTKALEMEGVKVTVIKAGKFKTEGAPWAPLSEEAAAAFQERVDALYGMFTSAVARGRGTTATDVANGYGEGRMLDSTKAKSAGLVDGVATFDQVVRRMARGDVGTSTTRIDAPAAELETGAPSTSATGLHDGPAHRISKLELEPGDRLVVSLDHKITAAGVAELRGRIESEYPGHPVTILSQGVDLSVLTETSPPAAAAGEPPQTFDASRLLQRRAVREAINPTGGS